MDTHDGRIARNLRQSGADALAACRATRDPFAGGVGRRYYEHDTVAGSLGRRDAPIENSPIAQQLVLLGATKALPATAGDNDRPHRFSVV